MKRPEGLSKEKWDSLSDWGKHWWIARVQQLGSVEAVTEAGRKQQSKASYSSILSEEDVEYIRARGSNKELASKFNVSESYISKIRNNRRK